MGTDPDPEIQKKIYNLISMEPGISLTKTAEKLQMPVSIIRYHLQDMERKKLLFVVKEGDYKKYYLYNQYAESNLKLRDQSTREIRQKILELIMQNPGLHLSKIADILEISFQLTDYHLLQLEKENEILGIKDSHGYYKRYYLPDSGVTSFEKTVLGMLRKKIPFEIILYLLKNLNVRHKDIMHHLKISSSRLSYHLTNLVNSNIIEVQFRGSEKGYSLKNRKELISIIKRYNITIEMDHAIEDFKDIWDDLKY